MSNTKKTIEKSQNENNASIQELPSTRMQIKQLQKQKNALKERNAALVKEIQAKEDEIYDIEHDLEAIKKIKDRYNAKKDLLIKMKPRLDAAVIEIENLESQRKQLTEKRATLLEQQTLFLKKHDPLITEKKQLLREYENLLQKRTQISKAISLLNEPSQRAAKRMQKLRSTQFEHDVLTTKINQINRKLTVNNTYVSDREKQVSVLGKSIKKIDEQTFTLDKQIETKEKITDKNELIRKQTLCENAINEFSDEIQKLENEITSIKTEKIPRCEQDLEKLLKEEESNTRQIAKIDKELTSFAEKPELSRSFSDTRLNFFAEKSPQLKRRDSEASPSDNTNSKAPDASMK